MRRLGVSIIVLAAVFISSCATTGPGGKKSLIFVSTGQETSLGTQFDKQIRSENRILADSAWQAYFNEIGESIVKVCDRKDIEYHFTVIESDVVNAFATPGGYVYIYTGLLSHIDNEAQLAAVTAHEISHVVARHSVKRLQSALGISVIEQIAFGSESSVSKDAINLGVGIALQGYSRSNELEADRFGVIYMSQAGYNPQGARELFEVLLSLQPDKQNFFEKLSATHPDTQERIKQVDQMLASQYQGIINRPKNADRYLKFKEKLPIPPPEKKP